MRQQRRFAGLPWTVKDDKTVLASDGGAHHAVCVACDVTGRAIGKRPAHRLGAELGVSGLYTLAEPLRATARRCISGGVSKWWRS